MKILIINKFLFPNGGSETYIFKLGDYLKSQGHEVQYFGMEHEGRSVGNAVNAYTSDMDFHKGSILGKLTYPIKTIYSREARIKIRKVLDDFEPDVCHLNNFNYQLTPSVILEIVKWRKSIGKECKILYTAHDYQLTCPNHMMNNPLTHANCEKCAGSHYVNCIRGRCIHGSMAKSIIAAIEACYWNIRGTYSYIDKIICCSAFLKSRLDTNPILADKTVVMHNFIDNLTYRKVVKIDYVLYFGRYSREKGVETLIEAAKLLPDIDFIFAGRGEYSKFIEEVPNIKDVGFVMGEELGNLIREARFSICPSEWYENCPFAVLESQALGTVVVGARIGGIPELVIDGVNGLLFESGNPLDLVRVIKILWDDRDKLNSFEEMCLSTKRDNIAQYVNKLFGLI